MTHHVFLCRANSEAGARAKLERLGMSVTILMHTKRVRTGRKGERVEVQRPLMPGYVFAAGDLTEELVFKACGGIQVPAIEGTDHYRARGPLTLQYASPIIGVLRTTTGDVASLRQDEIDRIEQQARSLRAKPEAPKFQDGQLVKATTGPLQGFHGIISRVTGNQYRWDVQTPRGPWSVTTDGTDLVAAE